jgi:hypothetical protein
VHGFGGALDGLVGGIRRRAQPRADGDRAQVYGYTAPGSAHTVLSDEPFYTEEVNGQRFVDWVTRLIARKPVDDVHCRQCRVG